MAAKRFIVSAVTRQGFDGFLRGGRKWPSGKGREVEVVDQPDDPPADPNDLSGVIKIGKETFKALQAEQHLNVRMPGDALEQSSALESLQLENAALKARIAALEANTGAQVPKQAEAAPPAADVEQAADGKKKGK